MGDSVDDLELNREEEWLMLCIFEETFSTQIKNQRPEQFDGPVMKGCKWYSLKKELDHSIPERRFTILILIYISFIVTQIFTLT